MDKKNKLNAKHSVFVDEYLSCFNATEAYSRAYPKAKRTTAGANGHELLKKAEIQEAITERLSRVHMSADEALKLQADIARGDITEFLTPLGNLDIDKLRASGRGRLVKKLKQKTITKIGKKEDDEDTEILETEIELYPADVAQERILKISGKFKERVDITSDGESVAPIDNERFDRAISTLVDAIRESVSGAGGKQNSEVASTK